MLARRLALLLLPISLVATLAVAPSAAAEPRERHGLERLLQYVLDEGAPGGVLATRDAAATCTAITTTAPTPPCTA